MLVAVGAFLHMFSAFAVLPQVFQFVALLQAPTKVACRVLEGWFVDHSIPLLHCTTLAFLSSRSLECLSPATGRILFALPCLSPSNVVLSPVALCGTSAGLHIAHGSACRVRGSSSLLEHCTLS